MIGLIDQRVRPFFWIEESSEALLETATERSIYFAIVALAKDSGYMFASQSTLADRSKVSTPTISRTLPKFEEKGLIERADEDEVMALERQLGYTPPTIVYKLKTPTEAKIQETQSVAKAISQLPLGERIIEAVRRAEPEQRRQAAVKVLAQYMRDTTGDSPSYGRISRMVGQVPDGPTKIQILVEAMEKACLSGVHGDRHNYMQGIISKKVRDTAISAPVPQVEGARPTARIEVPAFTIDEDE